MKQGLEDLQRDCKGFWSGQKSRDAECDLESERLHARCAELSSDNENLRERLRLEEELIASYKRLVDLWEAGPPPQGLSQGWQILPPNNGPNHCDHITLPPISLPPMSLPLTLPPLSLPLLPPPSSLPPPSLSHEFATDSNSLRPHEFSDYVLDSPFGPDPITPALISPFQDFNPTLSVKSRPDMPFTEQGAASASHSGGHGGSGGKADKPSKKRKSK